MTPNQLHDYLQLLKSDNCQSTNVSPLTDFKSVIRKELVSYKTDQPLPPMSSLTPYPSDGKDVVYYSFMESENNPKVGEHEYKRLKVSWSSLRKHNQDIEVRFCYRGDYSYAPCKAETEEEKWQSLCDDYGVIMYPFHKSFTGNEPNAWCIHRWYNLALWSKEDLNVLYMDADTYVNGDIQLVFDNYRRDPIYGREELGFRHDPNDGISGEDPRFYLDLVDASIVAQGGKTEVQKYCLGVILLNHSTHKLFTTKSLLEYTDLLERIQAREVFYSIPNYRIMDEFAFWVLMSRWSIRTSLFGNQDVSQTFLEQKHKTHFNPLILHYTTKDEEKFADWAPEFFCLSRNQEVVENINPTVLEEMNMPIW